MLLLAVGVTIAAAATLSLARRTRSALPETPFDPGALVARTRSGGSVALPRDSAYTLLYVSAHCPWCRAELERWVGRDPSDARSPAPIAVFGPDSAPAEVEQAVRDYPGPVLLDRDGALGRALGVSAVPYTAEIRSGTVVDVSVGLTRAPDPALPPSSAPTIGAPTTTGDPR